ncbi:MAG TPA: response regulator transcription factor [Patescibacteria group bacterium]|nr:response regulator transcription factor [Patescibacteria group bacterium]
MPLRIILAEDHTIVLEGLRALLEKQGFEIVGEAMDGRSAVELARQFRPDIAILDIAMPALNGIDAAREILRASPDTRTIILTIQEDNQYVVEALRAGVSGYLLKTKAASDLVQAIKEVSHGALYISPGLSRDAVKLFLENKDVKSDPLSPREREVLQLIAEGKTTKEVAAILGISVKTAESHRTRIMEKLDIHETATLVRYAIRRGVIQP